MNENKKNVLLAWKLIAQTNRFRVEVCVCIQLDCLSRAWKTGLFAIK